MMTVEPKLCEVCGRLFVRAAPGLVPYCWECVRALRTAPQPATPAELLAELEAEDARRHTTPPRGLRRRADL
jgi:hypothetical protein